MQDTGMQDNAIFHPLVAATSESIPGPVFLFPGIRIYYWATAR